MNQPDEQIINLSYSYFATHPVTPDSIRDFIKRAKGFFPEQTFDDKEIFNRLEAIHSVVIEGDAKILDEYSNHEEWFNPDTNLPLKRDFKWHFWDHYQQYLVHQTHWSFKIVQGLDRFSSLILSRMEDPYRLGPWDRRGMVVGNVQSGKTANYTALVTKAADAGYKLFIILAGVHNSLRSQTQERLNEEFLGYDLDIVQKVTGQERRIGVRRMFPKNHGVVNTLTSSAQDGDFKTAIARNAGIIPSLTGDPIILVVKKNVAILNNLIDWSTTLGYPGKNGRRVVRDIPFLLIDDECDFASVNTKKPERDENGSIIEEWDPTKTNLLIRELLSGFEKSIYVGYTATPYANIFIDKDDPHPILGEDLFPKHFLVSLPQPSNYMGPEEVFGLKDDVDAGIQSNKPLPLVRVVTDNEEIIPSSHKSGLNVLSLPDSLNKSIRTFILVCAARRIRRVGVPHNSMLVHVTRFTHVQSQVKYLVEGELRTLTARIMSGTDPLNDFRQIWDTDFLPTSVDMSKRGFRDSQMDSWERIRSELYPAVKTIRIKGINGEIGDTFDYRMAERQARERTEKGETVPWHERGTSVIAIGGDKLSRGLTLEGLSVSYYGLVKNFV
ncbi:MAG: Z1 domain-containing protein [Dehalococcoidales bacterium]|nr:Z1 domain-containing protein [Dehalococcoidales bacterium]